MSNFFYRVIIFIVPLWALYMIKDADFTDNDIIFIDFKKFVIFVLSIIFFTGFLSLILYKKINILIKLIRLNLTFIIALLIYVSLFFLISENKFKPYFISLYSLPFIYFFILKGILRTFYITKSINNINEKNK